MKDWHKLKPELFEKQPYYRPGCDKYPIVTLSMAALVKSAALHNACRSKCRHAASLLHKAAWSRSVGVQLILPILMNLDFLQIGLHIYCRIVYHQITTGEPHDVAAET